MKKKYALLVGREVIIKSESYPALIRKRIEILILEYNSKNYFISKYNTEDMMRYEKQNLVERWARRLSRELNIPKKELYFHFITQWEVGSYRLKPYATIKNSERKSAKSSDKDNISKLKITLERDFIN